MFEEDAKDHDIQQEHLRKLENVMAALEELLAYDMEQWKEGRTYINNTGWTVARILEVEQRLRQVTSGRWEG